MFALLALATLCSVATASYGAPPTYNMAGNTGAYYEEYSTDHHSREDYHTGKKCKKLKFYDVKSGPEYNVVREAQFSSLERNGKHYILITCPYDIIKVALVAEKSGRVADLNGNDYTNTVILTAGFNVQLLARCDGKRIKAKTFKGETINIEKVSCVDYYSNVPPPT